METPLRRAAKNPDAFWACRDVSFEVQRGEVMGLVGRNGAAKARCSSFSAASPSRPKALPAFADALLRCWKSAPAFIRNSAAAKTSIMNGAILGMKHAEIKRKFDQIVAFAEIEQFLDTAVKHYSSGMYVRLAFSRGGAP